MTARRDPLTRHAGVDGATTQAGRTLARDLARVEEQLAAVLVELRLARVQAERKAEVLPFLDYDAGRALLVGVLVPVMEARILLMRLERLVATMREDEDANRAA